jgi:hypothetical protein
MNLTERADRQTLLAQSVEQWFPSGAPFNEVSNADQLPPGGIELILSSILEPAGHE